MGFSRQEYWSGLPFILQGIFRIQGSNPHLLHCRQILYHLSHQGSPGNRWGKFKRMVSCSSMWTRAAGTSRGGSTSGTHEPCILCVRWPSGRHVPMFIQTGCAVGYNLGPETFESQIITVLVWLQTSECWEQSLFSLQSSIKMRMCNPPPFRARVVIDRVISKRV